MRQAVVIADVHTELFRQRVGELTEGIFDLCIARAQHRERDVLSGKLRRDLDEQIESFLLGESGDDSDQRSTIVARNIQFLQQRLACTVDLALQSCRSSTEPQCGGSWRGSHSP